MTLSLVPFRGRKGSLAYIRLVLVICSILENLRTRYRIALQDVLALSLIAVRRSFQSPARSLHLIGTMTYFS